MSDLTTVFRRPILFSGAMVRAILEGRKTQTRRVCKPADMNSVLPREFRDRVAGAAGVEYTPDWANAVYPARVSGWIAWGQGVMPNLAEFTKQQYEHGFPCPYGAHGVRLWVRETWAVRNRPAGPRIEYRADGASAPLPTHHDIRDEGGRVDLTRYVADRWRPSIHMPRWASRITLEVAGVRVERVQDISEADAQREGWDFSNVDPYTTYDPVRQSKAREWFAALWDGINDARGYGWQANPWVWVVEFGRIKP